RVLFGPLPSHRAASHGAWGRHALTSARTRRHPPASYACAHPTRQAAQSSNHREDTRMPLRTIAAPAARPLAPLAGVLVLCAAAPAAAQMPPKLPVPAFDQSAIGQRGYFYVGGKYVGEPGKEIMQGQVYVEVLAPKEVRRPYPLVLIHGAAQTATNWMGTPAGRKGWADFFVEQGYIVYMIDQPMRGRSAWHPGDGATRMFTAEQEAFQFTANAVKGTWPQGKKQTQWPGEGAGKGQKGDPIFDA